MRDDDGTGSITFGSGRMGSKDPAGISDCMSQGRGAVPRPNHLLFPFNPWNSVANLTGNPAMSVPLAWSTSGLPIGLLFTGRYGDEAGLFRLAGQLERAHGWADRVAP